jgi:hypothetical protein
MIETGRFIVPRPRWPDREKGNSRCAVATPYFFQAALVNSRRMIPLRGRGSK